LTKVERCESKRRNKCYCKRWKVW